MTRAGPSRREVLAGGGLLALAGCLPADEPAPRPTDPPELRRRARIAEEVRELAARYDAVVARFPESRAELATLAAEHEKHVVALLGKDAAPRRGQRQGTSPDATASPTATPAPPVPGTLAEARAALADAERLASGRRARQAGTASPLLARLLGSIAACEAAHAALLERGGEA